VTRRAPSGRERQHVVDALHAAVRAGTLDLHAFDQRLTAALAAGTMAELDALGVPPFRLRLRGLDGVAALHADRIVLEFDSRLSTQAVKKVRSPRSIPLPAIAAAYYTPGLLSEALRLRLVGEAPSYQPPHRADHDVNAILLNVGQRREAEAFVAEVNERVGLEPRVPEPQLLPPQHRLPGLPPPPPGELYVQVRTTTHLVTLDENGVQIEDRRIGMRLGKRRWLPLTGIAAVEFDPGGGAFRRGHVRFVLAGLPAGYRHPAPKKDANAFLFSSGIGEAGEAEELAAHVAARITGPRVVETTLLPGNRPADWGLPAAPQPTAPAVPPQPTGAAPAQLRELAKLRAEGLITDADYEQKKQEILRRW
jgi:Domain of unknown function (DUF1707)/Short C-terminal domain/Domain of unknown function (DUF4429)